MARFYDILFVSKQRLMSQKGTLVLVLMGLFLVAVAGQECANPFYIIPATVLDTIFDGSYNAIRSPANLLVFINNPTTQNLTEYLITLLPASAPLWGFAILMTVLFTGCAIQMCCYHTCNRASCGNEITSTAYQVGPIKCLMASFFILAIAIIITTAAALILNVGLVSAAYYTQCNAKSISTQLLRGNSNAAIPWSGAVNFGQYIQNATTNLLNALPSLASYFSASNAAYVAATAVIPGTSAYSLSQVYTCAISVATLNCPFSNGARCPSPLKVVFNEQFCNATFTGSSKNLIAAEMATNSTGWLNSIQSLNVAFSTNNVTTTNVNATVSQIQQFDDSFTALQREIDNVFASVLHYIYIIQIVLYVFYSFLLLGTLIALVIIGMAYCGQKFSLAGGATFFWIFYFLIGTAIFILSGFLIAYSIFSFDGCSAYSYYFSSQSNFNQLNFNNTKIDEVFGTCYFTNSTSVFDAFNLTVKNQISQIQTLYKNAVPASSFYSVVTNIQSTLNNYVAFPTTAMFVNQNLTNSALVALQETNNFANFSAPGSTQGCNMTRDYFSYSSFNCTPYLLDQTPPSNSCIVIESSNFGTIVPNRKSLFDGNVSCGSAGTTYQNNANALQSYSSSLSTMVNSLRSVVNSGGNGLQAYETNYFNYYTQVSNLMSAPVKSTFKSFLDPYTAIGQNSSCAFIKISTTALVDIACNQMFPYINGFAIVNIVLAGFILLIMIALYFIEPRLRFYGFLDGDFDNYGEKTYKISDLNQTEMTDRKQDLLNSADRRDV